jgi:putative endonuclease
LAPPIFIEKTSPESESTSKKGFRAENQIAEYLIRQGFEVLKRNWRTPYGEVDLVASKNNELWIFEIKSRKEKSLRKYRVLNPIQKERLSRAALWIWSQKKSDFRNFRCKLVVVTECGTKCLTLPLLYDQA